MNEVYVDWGIKIAIAIIVAVWGWAKAKYHLAEGKNRKIAEIVEESVVLIYRRDSNSLSLGCTILN